MSSGASACHLIGPQYKLETRCPCCVNLWSATLLSDKHYCRKETYKLRLLWLIALLVVNNTIKIQCFSDRCFKKSECELLPIFRSLVAAEFREGLSGPGAVLEGAAGVV